MNAAGPQRRERTIGGQRVSYVVKDKGRGGPTTLYLHGLGADAEQTRPLASGVPGRLVLLDLPSHGASADAPPRLGFDDLVEIARTVARDEGVTQALGVSLGSAVLLRWLIRHPDDLTRVALYLPAAVTTPRPGGRLRGALASEEGLREYVGGELPASIAQTSLAQRWLASRTEALRRAGIGAYADMLEREAPVDDPAAAAKVTTELLAIGARGDLLHPVDAATEAADCFPRGTVHIFDEAAPLWTARRALRSLLTGFLGEPDVPGAAAPSDNLKA